MAEVDYSLIAMARDVSSIIQLSGYVSRHGGTKYRRPDLLEVGAELKFLKDAITEHLEEYFRRCRAKESDEPLVDGMLVSLLDSARDVLDRVARRIAEIDRELVGDNPVEHTEVTGGSLRDCLAQVKSLLQEALKGLTQALDQARRGPQRNVHFA